MFNIGDKLLFVLNAKTGMRWRMFHKVIDTLYLSESHSGEDCDQRSDYENYYWKYATSRNFEALGHCDVLFGKAGATVNVAPAMLARLPHAGLPRAVLAGGRTPELVKQLIAYKNNSAEIEILEQDAKSGYSPTVIVVRAAEVSSLSEMAERLGIMLPSVPPAWSLINASGTLDEYIDSLEWEENAPLNWPRQEYDAGRFRFDDQESEGVSVLEKRINPTTKQFMYFYCKGSKRALVDKDWGRFMMLGDTGQNAMYYDIKTFTLGVPAKLPLPKLFSRAFALCSGMLPVEYSGSNNFIGENHAPLVLYKAVPQKIAFLAAAKLNQELISISFN